MKARLLAVCMVGLGAVACAPTYDPVCRGAGNQPLDPGELAQPSGLTLAGDVVYVASTAAEAPEGADYDYCGAFITPFDAATGKPAGAPFVPYRTVGDEREYFRFFAGLAWDPSREVLYVAERETGSVLKVDPTSGRVLAQVDTGRAPYALEFMADVETRWDESGETLNRDLLAVGDVGGNGTGGGTWLLELDRFSQDGLRPILVGSEARPSSFDFDPADGRLYVGLYDGNGVAAVDVADLRLVLETEPVGGGVAPVVRGVAAATEPTDQRIFFTAQSAEFGGLWVASSLDGQALSHLVLPANPSDVALTTGYVVALASDRLFFVDRDTLTLVRSVDLNVEAPARLLVDEARGVVYVTGFQPSTLKQVAIP